jgi:hypothetical protein
MEEHIARAVIRADESEATRTIEPFNGTGAHLETQ